SDVGTESVEFALSATQHRLGKGGVSQMGRHGTQAPRFQSVGCNSRGCPLHQLERSKRCHRRSFGERNPRLAVGLLQVKPAGGALPRMGFGVVCWEYAVKRGNIVTVSVVLFAFSAFPSVACAQVAETAEDASRLLAGLINMKMIEFRVGN